MAQQGVLDLGTPPIQVSAIVTTTKNASTDFRQPNPNGLRPGFGTGQCLCGGCQRPFNSVSAFDRHQTLRKDGSVVCRDPASLGMVTNERGWWVLSLDTRKHAVSEQAAAVLEDLAR